MNSPNLFQIDEEEEDYNQDDLNENPDAQADVRPQKPASPTKIDNQQKNVITKKRNDSKIDSKQSTPIRKIEFDQDENQIQLDVSAQIAELKAMIESRNQQFEVEFDELKRKHQAKLKMLKQTHITREQTKSNAFDLEYRNLIWTTTLKHLDRGCFTDDLRLLFQQAISDEQYRLEKDIIKMKQKNEEEIQNLKENMPKMQLKKKSKKTFINLDIMDPVEMAQIIYNNCFLESGVDNYYDYEIHAIEKIIQKVQNDSLFISSCHLKSPNRVLKQKHGNEIYEKKGKRLARKKRLSPKLQRDENYKICVQSHQEACQRLEKSVKETDKFIKNLQDKDWFNDMFPHVE